MTETIAALRAERERLTTRIRMIDAALEKYEAWALEATELLAMGLMPHHPPAVTALYKEAPGVPSDEATPMPEFESQTRDLLESTDRPLMRGPFLKELRNRGVIVGGADERNTLSARLSRLDWVVNLRGHGYWLKSRDYDPASYRADDTSSSAVVGNDEAPVVDAFHDVLE